MKHILTPLFRFVFYLVTGIVFYIFKVVLFLLVLVWEFDFGKAKESLDMDFVNDTGWDYFPNVIYKTPLDAFLKRNSYKR